MVARRHSACVNIVPVHRSVYRWQGKICDDCEFLLVIKTLEEEYEAVEAAVKELHSYELPEILAFQVSRGEGRFLDWIAQALDKRTDFAEDGDGGEAQPRPDTAD